MDLQRRLLPSMSMLTAFEAAARTGSFTAAAAELSLTQGAVSRQIKALEDQIGTPLFTRKGQRVTLTPTGALYADPILDAGLGGGERRRLFLPIGTDAATAAKLRSQGWVAVAALEDGDTPEAQLCSHVLANGEPTAI